MRLKTVTNRLKLATLMLLALTLTAPTFAQEGDTDCKNQLFLSSVTKGRLSDDDRAIVKDYLKEHKGEFRQAPNELVAVLDATRIWTDDMDRYAEPVPKKLLEDLSKPVDGTVWVVFNRAFVVVEKSTKRMIDRVRIKQ